MIASVTTLTCPHTVGAHTPAEKPDASLPGVGSRATLNTAWGEEAAIPRIGGRRVDARVVPTRKVRLVDSRTDGREASGEGLKRGGVGMSEVVVLPRVGREVEEAPPLACGHMGVRRHQ